LHGVTGSVAISSGVLTSITNAVVVTATAAAPVYVTSTITSPVMIAENGGITVDGAVLATGNQTPTDTFSNPTTAMLAQVFNMLWNGSTWARAPGSVSGTIVQTKPSTLANVTQVSIPGNSATTILAANVNRLGASIQSVASASYAVHVKMGSTPTLASYTVRIAQNGYYEVPSGYNGIITGICSGSQVVQVNVTEYVPV
jgi:hypothetical protein